MNKRNGVAIYVAAMMIAVLSISVGAALVKTEQQRRQVMVATQSSSRALECARMFLELELAGHNAENVSGYSDGFQDCVLSGRSEEEAYDDKNQDGGVSIKIAARHGEARAGLAANIQRPPPDSDSPFVIPQPIKDCSLFATNWIAIAKNEGPILFSTGSSDYIKYTCTNGRFLIPETTYDATPISGDWWGDPVCDCELSKRLIREDDPWHNPQFHKDNYEEFAQRYNLEDPLTEPVPMFDVETDLDAIGGYAYTADMQVVDEPMQYPEMDLDLAARLESDHGFVNLNKIIWDDAAPFDGMMSYDEIKLPWKQSAFVYSEGLPDPQDHVVVIAHAYLIGNFVFDAQGRPVIFANVGVNGSLAITNPCPRQSPIVALDQGWRGAPVAFYGSCRLTQSAAPNPWPTLMVFNENKPIEPHPAALAFGLIEGQAHLRHIPLLEFWMLNKFDPDVTEGMSKVWNAILPPWPPGASPSEQMYPGGPSGTLFGASGTMLLQSGTMATAPPAGDPELGGVIVTNHGHVHLGGYKDIMAGPGVGYSPEVIRLRGVMLSDTLTVGQVKLLNPMQPLAEKCRSSDKLQYVFKSEPLGAPVKRSSYTLRRLTEHELLCDANLNDAPELPPHCDEDD